MALTKNCPFCRRISTGDVEEIYKSGVVRFEPLNPVTPGHMLFVPGRHTLHPDPHTAALTIAAASHYAARTGLPFNIITSYGAAATQTVEHIHIHYVPRSVDDGLTLPWTGQKR